MGNERKFKKDNRVGTLKNAFLLLSPKTWCWNLSCSYYAIVISTILIISCIIIQRHLHSSVFLLSVIRLACHYHNSSFLSPAFSVSVSFSFRNHRGASFLVVESPGFPPPTFLFESFPFYVYFFQQLVTIWWKLYQVIKVILKSNKSVVFYFFLTKIKKEKMARISI